MSLYLVDGHALAYRSYYAFIRNPLVNSKGEETSAVYGFLNTMLNLLERFDPTHVAVVFDESEVTFRKEMFTEYKANRPKMPDSLKEQLPRIQEVLSALSIPCLSKQGFEADDIIATLAKQHAPRVPVRIVSGDKDLMQVLSEETHVIRPGQNGLLGDEIDPGRLQEELGLTPAQFIDYQALMGDSTDNVPGVKGVGKKTALKLIHDYGSLEGVYENLDAITSKSLRGKLETDRDNAFLSRQLVRLDNAVPMEVGLDDLSRGRVDMKVLRPMLRDLEFYKILESLEGEGFQEPEPEPEREAIPLKYELVDSQEKLNALAQSLQAVDEFALDVETSDIDPMRAVLAGISIAWEPGAAYYVPVTSQIEDDEPNMFAAQNMAPGLQPDVVHAALQPLLADAGKRKIGQHIKYDALVLRNAGYEVAGVHFDTMLASYVLQPERRSHGLDNLVDEIFRHRMTPFKDLFDSRVSAKQKDIRTVALARAKDYACEDADYTLRLKQEMAPTLEASQVRALFYDVEMPLSAVLMDMEGTGVKLDVAFLRKLSDELATSLAGIENDIYDQAGERFNINSTAHLQRILFDKLGLEPTHKTKTGFSTDIDVLKALGDQHPVPALVIDYRMKSKLKSTYVDALPRLINRRTGRVHTSFNQAVTSTGRLSSSDPNLQNIPIRTELGREIRKAFIADEGNVLVDADYSQIELRILAHVTSDPELIQAFVDDDDVHRRTAARINGVAPEDVTDDMRARAKTVNFGIIYGMGARGLAQSLGISVEEAKQFIDDYFANYPGVKQFIDETINSARETGSVSTLMGRIRRLPDIDARDRRVRSFNERTAVNTPIQGTAADIIKVAMIDLDRRLKAEAPTAKLLLQVHDELLVETPQGEVEAVQRIIREAMESAIALAVPLKVDMATGHNWLEAHD